MQIEQVNIEALIPYARNSRTHSGAQVAQIAASIKEFGFTNPVLIDANNVIIAGHGRVLGAQKLGIVDVPCIRLGHLTEAQRRAYVIADNKIALNAGWDDEMLKLELEDLKLADFNLDLTGLSDAELSKFIDMPEADRPEASGAEGYQEQYGVIVICENAKEQERTYNTLIEMKLNCKVVNT